MPKSLYFGHGSNLNADDWSRWCLKNKYAETSFDASFKKVTNAWLADYRPGFTVYSGTQNGGVLDIIEVKGCVTPGVLFEVNEDSVAKLDRWTYVYVRPESGRGNDKRMMSGDWLCGRSY